MGKFVLLNCICLHCVRGEIIVVGGETYDYNSHSYTLIKWDNLQLIEEQGN